jgi:hypothetical protein
MLECIGVGTVAESGITLSTVSNLAEEITLYPRGEKRRGNFGNY